MAQTEAAKGLHVTHRPLSDLAAECDYLISACPLTDATKHLINSEFLGSVKAGCYLINIARGSVVDEEAVADALESGHLAGYAADVFEMEDWLRSDRPRTIPQRLLARRDVTLFTPHLGSAVERVRIEIAREAARSIVQCLTGDTPQGAINHPVRPEI